MKTKGLSLVLLGIMWVCAPAAAFELTDSITGGLDPVITMEKHDSDVTVGYIFPGAYHHEDDLYPGTFNFAIPGFGSNGMPGEAAWLIHWDTFEILYGCEAAVQTLASETLPEYCEIAVVSVRNIADGCVKE